MVKLRFQRHGRTHAPFYRLVAVDARFKRNGRYLENLGWFNPEPGKGEKDIELKEDRIQYWLSVGAQPSETVRDLLGHRDMLTAKQKKAWEADRKYAKLRVEAASAVKGAEAALAAVSELAGDADADLSSFVSTAREAAGEAKSAANKGQVEAAQAAAKKAEDAKAAAEKAEADHKAAEEAKKAAEEAAAKEAEAAESSDEGGEGESSE
ncbi:MAG: 30S ribosomal protein S16 [Planctomycetota bacterium]